jgi:nucleoside-diphosphate-sugar epimerase
MSELVLVTGGTGYIGGWCVAELLRRGYRVRTTVRHRGKEPQVAGAVATAAGPAEAGRVEFAVADLTQDAGWDQAVDGARYVLHVASPLGDAAARDRDALVAPAREGTLRVLRAAAAAGAERVVMTSAANAASPSSYAEDGITDETLWTDPDDPAIIGYRRSKTLAELAAWEFMNDHGGRTELVTVLPDAVFGPILTTATIGSVGIIARMLAGRMAGAPRIGLEVVDVRDLVDAHLRAMTVPEAAGQRFLATGEFTWMRDMALALRHGLGEDGSRVSARQVPDVIVRLTARFRDPSLRAITPSLGRRNRHSIAKAQRVLGWQPRPAAQTVVDCGRSLIAFGVPGSVTR